MKFIAGKPVFALQALIASSLLMLFQNCNKAGFESMKFATLQSNSVFGGTGGSSPYGGVITQPGGTNPGGGTINQPGGSNPGGGSITQPGGSNPGGGTITQPGGGGSNPGGSNPGGSNPGGSNPGGSNPGGSNPGGSNPGGSNPGGSNPGGSNPGGSNPGGSNPGGSNPGGSNPGGSNPSGSNPSGSNPGGSNPGGSNPGGSNPGGSNPGGSNPGGSNPSGSNPSGSNPGGSNPGGSNPGGSNPGGSNPGGSNPGGSNPGGSNPGGSNPGGSNPGGSNPGGSTPGGSTPGGSNPGGSNPGGSNPGGSNPGGSTPGGSTPGGSTSGNVTPPPTTSMQIDLYCSGGATQGSGGYQGVGWNLSISPTSTMNYIFMDSSNQTAICQTQVAGAREDIVNTSHINIDNLAGRCPNLTTGNYIMYMNYAPGTFSALFAIPDMMAPNWWQTPLTVAVTRNADQSMSITPTSPATCTGWNDTDGCRANFGPNVAKVLYSQLPVCPYNSSPLVLQLEENGPITLTPPLSGIEFDIDGTNAKPAHSPRLISWFTPESAKVNYWLVLPDAHGNVRGIDQMFGDNTLGPDGKTPKSLEKKDQNGYEALRKWDGRRDDGTYGDRDGFITAKDPVFARLRLWHDDNHDGIAQANELSTLSERHVRAIDLGFVDSLPETDKYGNQVKFKSVVQTDDGRTHLIYDLWFRTLDPSARPTM